MNLPQVDRLVVDAQKPVDDIPDWLTMVYHSVEYEVHHRINYYRFLNLLVKQRQPSLSIELGVHYGVASAMMAVANYGHVIGVDILRDSIPERIIAYNCPNYHYIHKNSIDAFQVVQELVTAYGRIGVVFQDSSHHYDASVQEWDLYSTLLDDGAIWVCDDITPAFRRPEEPKGMVEYFYERPGTKVVYPDRLHYGNTVGVILL